jgi:hypothetical protein
VSESEKEVIVLKKKDDLWICEIDSKEYGFKKWTWGEKNKVISISMRISPDGTSIFDASLFNLNMLLATLKKAPFAINKETLESADSKLIDKLLRVTTKLNLLEPVEIKNL